jgi:hypothetical protein
MWEVWQGRPSWHQQKAGHGCASITSGFPTKEEADECARKYREKHPGEPAFARPTQEALPVKSKNKRSRKVRQ